MRARFVFALTTPLVVLLSGCSRPEPESVQVSDRDLALISVNGVNISVDDFERSYVHYLMATGSADTRKNRYLHAANLIDAELLSREAHRRGIDRDSTYKVFEERERRKAAGGRFFEEAFLNSLEPLSESEIRRAFVLSNEKAIVRHLFYRDSASAGEAYRRLLTGTRFVDEAQRCFHTAKFDSMAGYLGPIRYFQVDDAFAEAAFGLKVGEFSAPVRSRFGYHIILLEDLLRNPILTESEFQTKKEGVASQLRLRTRRLQGDRFVRSYMEGLDVKVNPEGIGALADALEIIEQKVSPQRVSLEEGAADFTPGSLVPLQPNTPLARYRFKGKDRIFTAEQYAFWLDDLPFSEARSHTAASVGRALRNEVFAVEGALQGFDKADDVDAEIKYQARIYLAKRLRYQLEKGRPIEVDDALLEEVYRRAGLDSARQVLADFWVIPCADRREAEETRQRIAQDPAFAKTHPRYQAFTQRRISEDRKWGTYVRRAPLSQPVVTGLSDGSWALLQVSRLTTRKMALEDEKSGISEAIKPLVAEYELLKMLRTTSTITLDTLRFEEIMEVTGVPSEKSDEQRTGASPKQQNATWMLNQSVFQRATR